MYYVFFYYLYMELRIEGLKGALEIPAKNKAKPCDTFKKVMWQVGGRQ